MSSDEDSLEERYIFSGGLTTKKPEERRIAHPSTRTRTTLKEANSSDSDDEIVVMPPVNNVKTTSIVPSNPRLTAKGRSAHDPVNMADDYSSSDDSTLASDEPNLMQRLTRRLEATKQRNLALDSSSSINLEMVHSSTANSSLSLETTYSFRNNISRPQMVWQEEKSWSSSESSNNDNAYSIDKITSKNQQSFAIETKNATLDNESDSDDSLLTLSQICTSKTTTKVITERAQNLITKAQSEKSNQKGLAKELRDQARRDKQLAKEMDKDIRQRQRMEKQRIAEAEKENKKRRREESEQIRGKHAIDEIAVLMEHTLCNHDELTLLKDLQESGFLVENYLSGLGCDVVQFVRSDYINGGGAKAVEMVKQNRREEYQHIPIVGVVFHDPMDFISKIVRDVHDEDDDYPKLESFLKGLEFGWRAAWKRGSECRPRFIFYLNNVNAALDKLWVKSRRKDQSVKPPPTGEELQDALIWLSIQFCVDCIQYICPEDLSTQLTKMAVWLAREPYQRQMTDLECAKKTRMQCSDMDPPLVRSQDCWRRQLCQVPGISETMATSVIGYFPTIRSLYLRYQDPNLTEEQKSLLLSDCFGRDGRKDVKCSDAVYRLLTSKNPSELI